MIGFSKVFYASTRKPLKHGGREAAEEAKLTADERGSLVADDC
jgi:hypothetical protein